MNDLVYRLKKRAEIRRSIASRKSVQLGEPDRIADLLDEAAARITQLEAQLAGPTSCSADCGCLDCLRRERAGT